MRTFRAARNPHLAVAAAMALLVGACGSAAPSATPTPAPSVVAPSSAPAASTAPSALASASPTATVAACGSYAGPPVTITYAMWGDTTELANQQKIVDAFKVLNPNITVKVSVADWDIVLAQAADGPRGRKRA